VSVVPSPIKIVPPCPFPILWPSPTSGIVAPRFLQNPPLLPPPLRGFSRRTLGAPFFFLAESVSLFRPPPGHRLFFLALSPPPHAGVSPLPGSFAPPTQLFHSRVCPPSPQPPSRARTPPPLPIPTRALLSVPSPDLFCPRFFLGPFSCSTRHPGEKPPPLFPD